MNSLLMVEEEVARMMVTLKEKKIVLGENTPILAAAQQYFFSMEENQKVDLNNSASSWEEVVSITKITLLEVFYLVIMQNIIIMFGLIVIRKLSYIEQEHFHIKISIVCGFSAQRAAETSSIRMAEWLTPASSARSAVRLLCSIPARVKCFCSFYRAKFQL